MRLSLTMIIKLSLIALSLGGFLFFFGAALADASSSDAIAVRVMANDNNYSAVRWYKEQKFSGAPQNLLVDDYEAVRDGRTVYVNAANINNNNFYTQIYVISYNQAAQPSTVDIFGQLLSHWKFNSNIADLIEKQKIIRDTKRLADLADLKTYLEKYKIAKNDYPRLAAGSYIASSSVSTWPSWQDTLAKELGVTLPVDPINKLEPCATPAGYDEKTCWNQADKTFYFQFDDPGEEKSITTSHVYWYQNGEFNVNLETKAKYKNLEKIGGVNFSNLETSLRFDPELHGITAAAGQNFEYQVKVHDPFLANQNAYDLAWTVEKPAATLEIKIDKTTVSNIAKISGKVQSGQAGAFVINIKVLDKRVNKTLEGSFEITVAPSCDNKAGYHLENGTCVQCPMDTQTTKSVSWVSGKCVATACQNEDENFGFHAEGGICKSNTDIYFCPKPEGVSGLTRYWNSGADKWGDCQITSCWTDKGYHLENGQCVQCRVANATSVKWDSNTCKVLACKDGYKTDDGLTCVVNTIMENVITCDGDRHIENEVCVSNTRNCLPTNATAAGTQNWLPGANKWGSCGGYTCGNDYPLSVADYKNTGLPACVNACGLIRNDTPITFTSSAKLKDSDHYVSNYNRSFNMADGVTEFGQINSGKCGTIDFGITMPVSSFIKKDDINGDKCQFTVKSLNDPRTVICGSDECWITVRVMDEKCRSISSELFLKKYISKTYVKPADGSTNWLYLVDDSDIGSTMQPYCGNGIKEGTEECDGLSGLTGYSCYNSAGQPSCASDCRRKCDSGSLYQGSCGNGLVEAPEICDRGTNPVVDYYCTGCNGCSDGITVTAGVGCVPPDNADGFSTSF